MTPSQPITRDEVLYAFAVEDHGGREILIRYLNEYPQYANALVDLSRELARPELDDSLSSAEDEYMDAAVARFLNKSTKQAPPTLAAQAFNVAAERLQLPLLVMLAFRERRVDLTSVPKRFLERLAEALETSLEQLRMFLSQPAMASATRQSKSRIKPVTATKVPFDKVLRDAGVASDRVYVLVERGE